MIKVVIVAGTLPARQAVLAEALERFRQRGAEVKLACHFDVARLPLDEGLAERHSLTEVAGRSGPRFRAAVKRAEPPRQVWLHARRDAWLRRHARRADVLVALDARALHTVWQLAQRNRSADAIYGLTASLKAVDARLADPARYARRRLLRPGPSPLLLVRTARTETASTAKSVARKAFGHRVMRSSVGQRVWRAALSAPGLPDPVRISLAERVHASMTGAGRPEVAARTATAAAGRLGSPRARADLLGRVATAELARGNTPQNLGEAVAAELALGDIAHKRGDAAAAGASLAKVIPLLFHRVVHFDQMSSPLAADPEAFLAPLHRSAIARALATPRGRSAPAAAPPTGRPQRVLFVTRANDNFLTEIHRRYATLPETEVRFLDLAADPMREPLTRRNARLIEHLLTGESEYGTQVQQWLGPHIEWADTVFVDWCVVTAAMVTMLDPGNTRVIIRLHSFEAFTLWPHVVDYSRVDDLIFVSEHLRDLTLAAVPGLRAPDAPRTHVIANAMDLRRYPRDKPADARFVLGMVGISAVAKDPRWTVEVLRLLRDRDPRYRLLLIGTDVSPVSAAAKRYHAQLEKDIADLEAAGAVRRLGQTDDVPGALTDVGVIVSASVRESFHCALAEGAASGAVPVVRNWPFFAHNRHGAHTLFPAEWIAESPAQAAERILKLTATEDGWREAGRAASAHALTVWDWTVTQRDFDRLLLGR